MFRNREEAAQRLASKLKNRSFRDPVVLGIPRGGLAIGAVLARELGAELDVVLSRKLRAPRQPELAVGAVSENGEVYLNQKVCESLALSPHYLAQEKRLQREEILRRQKLFRRVRPQVEVAGRSVIVTDDGIATGSTMIAALKILRGQKPHEIIVAVPVASPDRLDQVREFCDDTVCLLRPEMFYAIGQYYQDFSQLSDDDVVEILKGGKNHSTDLHRGTCDEESMLK